MSDVVYGADKGLLVSVIIPCFNYGRTLPESIDSVLASTWQNIEVIVVDDGSTDELTLSVLNQVRDSGICVVRQENKGLPAARNAGIGVSKGKYFLCLDADDLIRPTFVEKSVLLLESCPAAAFAAVWVELFGDENYVWRPAESGLLHWMFENLSAATGLTRRSAWEQVGGYDEAMRKGYEDWDFWLKVLKAGWSFRQIREPLLRYRKHGVTMLQESRARHAELIGKLRANHPDLYNRRKIGELMRLGHVPPELVPESMLDLVTLTKRTAKHALRRVLPVPFRRVGRRLYNRLPKPSPSLPEGLPPVSLSAEQWPVLAENLRPLPQRQGTCNILFMVPWLEVGGADKVNLDILSALDSSKFSATVVSTLMSDQPWWDRFHAVTPDLFHLPSLSSEPAGQYEILRYLIRTRKIDMVFVSNSEAGFGFLEALKRDYPDMPIVSLLHMYVPTDPWDYVRVARKVDAYIDRHVAITRGLRSVMVDRLGFDPDKVVVIENAVDEARFSLTVPDESLRREFDLPEGKRVIGFLARMADQKQPLAFVEVAKLLSLTDYYDDLRFLMVGEGPLLEAVRERVRGLGMESRFILPGARRDVPGLLSLMDVIVNPSLAEGLPILGLEAMAAGTPIVATRVVGWQDLVVHEQTGLLAEAFDVVDMAKQVLRLLREPELSERLVEAARAEVRARYSISTFAERYVDLFQSLSGKTPAHS